MNYYFLIDFSEIGLNSAIDIFNFPPIQKLYKKKIEDKKIILFYSDENKWNFYEYGIIKKNTFITINNKNLPNKLVGKSVFLYLEDIDKNFNINNNSKYTESVPEWRCNIRIQNENTSCSYQGEYPGFFIKKNLSLVSCSPMVQINDNLENYFILVNLNINPKIEEFKVEILDAKKQILDCVTFYTNTINKYNLNHFNNIISDKMLIFRSIKKGGVPLYFSRNIDNKSMSLEHTHPPQAYFIFGDTLKYQKYKKNFWFK